MICSLVEKFRSYYFNSIQIVSEKCNQLQEKATGAIHFFSSWINGSRKSLCDYIVRWLPTDLSSKSQRVFTQAYGRFKRPEVDESEQALKTQRESDWFETIAKKRNWAQVVQLENQIVDGVKNFNKSFEVASTGTSEKLEPKFKISWHIKSDKNETICCHFWGLQIPENAGRKRQLRFSFNLSEANRSIKMEPISGFYQPSSSFRPFGEFEKVEILQKIDDACNPIPFRQFKEIKENLMRYNTQGESASYLIEIKKESHVQERYFIIEMRQSDHLNLGEERSLAEYVGRIKDSEPFTTICEKIMKDLGIQSVKRETDNHDD
jgi:hypothetical protein